MNVPIKVIDVEWDGPYEELAGIENYNAVRALVRHRGAPIGDITVPLTGDGHPAALLRNAILKTYRGELQRRTSEAKEIGHSRPENGRNYDRAGARLSRPEAERLIVTVAVCTRDRTDDLSRCLDALTRQNYPDLEVLVVDNAPPTDASERLVSEDYPGIRYVREPRPGLNWARNRAILEARGDIIAFTDDDVVVDKGWVRALTAPFVDDETVFATTGLVVPIELETEAQLYFERYGGFGCGFQRRRFSANGGLRGTDEYFPGVWAECGTGASMAFRRSLFDAVGPFDPALDAGTVTNGGGDVEMFYRVLKSGYVLQYEPAAVARHRHRREYEQLRKQIESWGSGFYACLSCSARAFPDERLRLYRIGVRGIWTRVYRLLQTLVRSPGFPRDLIVAELRGALVGGIRYAQARKIANEISSTYGPVSRTLAGQTSGDRDGLPPISLIIPSRNRPDLLAETVESILQGDHVPAELIVVDQSEEPQERLAALATDRECDVRYLHDASVGASRARNLGIGSARYDILVFTDDDVLVTRTWLKDLADALLDGGSRCVVTGRVLPAAQISSGGFVPSTRTDPYPVDYEGRIGEDILYSNNMALYRSAIDEVGDFDVRLVNAEDNELAFRLLEAGYRILYRPEAVLYHRAWRSNRDYISLRWSYGRGQGEYYGKHLNLHDRYMLGRLVREMRDRSLRLMGYLVRRPGRAAGEITYIVALVYGLTRWFLTHARDS